MTPPDPLDADGQIHDCRFDPGPIYSPFAAMAFLMTAVDCSAEDCMTRSRAEDALRLSTSAPTTTPSRMCGSELETALAEGIYARTHHSSRGIGNIADRCRSYRFWPR
jgi:hypothetical protein